jgi:hypothetical protein
MGIFAPVQASTAESAIKIVSHLPNGKLAIIQLVAWCSQLRGSNSNYENNKLLALLLNNCIVLFSYINANEMRTIFSKI